MFVRRSLSSEVVVSSLGRADTLGYNLPAMLLLSLKTRVCKTSVGRMSLDISLTTIA